LHSISGALKGGPKILEIRIAKNSKKLMSVPFWADFNVSESGRCN